MNGSIRFRTIFGPFIVGVLTTLGLLCATYALAAADTGIPGPVSVDATARWYADGRLAGPVVLGVYVLLRLVIAASNSRQRGLAWLRAPGRLAAVSSAVAALSVLLPAVANGSITWGGVIVALGTGGALAANGTAAPVEPPATHEGDEVLS